MTRLVICSPQPTQRAGLRVLLSSDPDLVVADAAGRLSAPLSPDIEVLVVSSGALELAYPAIHPGLGLLLVASGEPDGLREARLLPGLDLRAWGVISPDATAEALQAAVHALAQGLVVASLDILQPMLAAAPGTAGAGDEDEESEPAGPHDRLTERESEVLRLVAQGLTNKQIALALKISEHTVKFHVSSIYSKLGATNRTEAARKGARRGWVPL